MSRLVIFDLGGVVCRFSHARRLEALARASRLSLEEVHERLFASGFDLECDRGTYTLEQQCAEIRARLQVDCDQHQLALLWAEAFVPEPDVLALASRARIASQTAILTNNGPLVELMLRECLPAVTASFDYLRFSYQAKSIKPEPRAFVETLAQLGYRPEQCVFIDDAQPNVTGARAVGIDAIHFESAAALAVALRERQLVYI